MKNAIRITNGEGKWELFAVCEDGPETTRHYNLAIDTIEKDSSDWISVKLWTKPYQFNPIMWHEFNAGYPSFGMYE